ncbi:MAG TPA: hypothetical protein VFM88_01250 [Vicinamibacteria bacterium]|nr:hypothetical protein [Vicinamibacteria bacterium]
MSETLSAEREQEFWSGVDHARRFFMGEADVQKALERLSALLDRHGIPYAIIGAMALNEWGYRRVTIDVDVLLSPDGLRRFKDAELGRGYREKFPGSRGLHDTENGVDVDVVLAGEFPGDGKPKPVAFPEPAQAAVRGRRVALLPLPKLIELKLASGISAPHRLKDLADVLELIRGLRLPETVEEALDPWVRAKYRELWQAAQQAPDE